MSCKFSEADGPSLAGFWFLLESLASVLLSEMRWGGGGGGRELPRASPHQPRAAALQFWACSAHPTQLCFSSHFSISTYSLTWL